MQCEKGMTKDTCPYNPNLGCDCGLNPRSAESIRAEIAQYKKWIKENPTYFDGVIERCRWIKELQVKLQQMEMLEEDDHPNTCRCEVCRFWS